MLVLKELFYTEDHEWVKLEGNLAMIGITDYAQHAMGDVVYVELPEVGAILGKGETVVVLESVKAAADVYMPVTGTIVEINEFLNDSPEALNKAPYQEYLVVIKDFSEAEIKDLMDADAYTAFIEAL